MRLAAGARNVAVLTRRNLIHIRRDLMQLSGVTIQPVLLTVLFVYIFGAGIRIAGGSYKDYVLAGLISVNLTTAAEATAIGLTTDLTTGVIDRFRTLPMWRAAITVGRTASDLLSSALCIGFVLLTGLVIGWRPHARVSSVLAGVAVALIFGYALSWANACVGLATKGPEGARSVGLLVLFPLAFVSNALVPTEGMPGWLRLVADWNPVSAVTAAMRTLFGNPNPAAGIRVWPMQHPVLASLGWSALLLALCGPLAAYLFRRRTSS